jgi:membrane-bound lytic murein transglycosylase A
VFQSNHVSRIFLLFGLLALVGCAGSPLPPKPLDRLDLSSVTFEALPGWKDDRLSEALPALLSSCAKLTSLSVEHSLGLGGKVGQWRAPCEAAKQLSPGDTSAAKAFFERYFRPFKAKSEGLLTGYYEVETTATRTRKHNHQVPLYAPPNDLVSVELGQFSDELKGQSVVGLVEGGKLKPYTKRADIEISGLDRKSTALYWLDDPIDAHILHIQGSGRLRLDDGSLARVGFAASNGHKFVGLGSIVARHDGPSGSMQEIRQWLKNRSHEAPSLMRENPRYIFFRKIEGEGPIGAQGVALTAGRSLAVDSKFLPFGIPVWLDSTHANKTKLRRLVISQDTGAAIKGPARGDLFFGTGEAALAEAGGLKNPANWFILLPVGVSGKI